MKRKKQTNLQPRLLSVSLSDGSRSPWQYSRWADIGGTPVAGRLGVYPNGGYVQDMTGTLDEVNACLTQLQVKCPEFGSSDLSDICRLLGVKYGINFINWY